MEKSEPANPEFTSERKNAPDLAESAAKSKTSSKPKSSIMRAKPKPNSSSRSKSKLKKSKSVWDFTQAQNFASSQNNPMRARWAALEQRPRNMTTQRKPKPSRSQWQWKPVLKKIQSAPDIGGDWNGPSQHSEASSSAERENSGPGSISSRVAPRTAAQARVVARPNSNSMRSPCCCALSIAFSGILVFLSMLSSALLSGHDDPAAFCGAFLASITTSAVAMKMVSHRACVKNFEFLSTIRAIAFLILVLTFCLLIWDRMQQGEIPCHYKVLRVSQKSSLNDVKRSRRDLLKHYHPDKAKNFSLNVDDSTKKSMEINAAFKVLTDVESKNRYDKLLEDNPDACLAFYVPRAKDYETLQAIKQGSLDAAAYFKHKVQRFVEETQIEDLVLTPFINFVKDKAPLIFEAGRQVYDIVNAL